MKSQLLTNLKNNTLFYCAAIILIAIVLVNPFSTDIANYLETQIDSITLSLGILLELKAAASSTSSSHIPLISGISASTLDSLSTAIHYLSYSDLLVTVQLVLIALTKSMLIPVTMVAAFLGSLIPKYKSVSLKVLVLLLLINPGLPMYVSGIQYITKEAKLDIGNDLSQELQETQAHYKQKELEHAAKEEERKKSQLEEAEAQGEDHISKLKIFEDKATDELSKIGSKIEEDVSEAYLVLKTACKAITVKTINLFTAILIQFILLPFLFFYGLFTLYQKFLTGTTSDAFLEKIVLLETLFVAIISLSHFI